MLDLTREEKFVIIFVIASLLAGSCVTYYKNRPGCHPEEQGDLLSPKDISRKVVNINTADINALISVKGIGVKTAERIVDYRQVNGGFFSKEDIMNIRGIGPSKYEALRDQISAE
ncbi:MAG: ComEA family DNA-binding protein [Candidatus Omnitrophota bacterium]